ncbi:MAG: alpha/beta fold hydrolase [Acidobacteria bacterium]|nr:alpha/beta fold hydrolase [Acidobacteriota bacterium]
MLAGAFALPVGLRAQAFGMGEMLWDYELEYIRLLEDIRQKRYDSIQTPEGLVALRRHVRTGLAEMWGPFPDERTPLNASETGRIDRGDYTIEKVIFESRPRFHVTANLYKPKNAQAKLPAIVFPCGHSANGKAAETYQRFCILAARHGFVTLIFDPVGQGERLQLWEEAKQASRAGTGTSEHRALGDQCYFVGLNLMNYRAWDVSRAIDYLESRDDVDPTRIAMAGNSGGGMVTLQYATFDDRVAAAVPSCAVASFAAKTKARLMADPEQILYGTLRRGIEHVELLATFAPKPLLIGSAIRDYVPIEAARATYRDVQRAYRIVAAEDHVAMVETDAGHGLNQELREQAVDWLMRWLGHTSRAVKEGEATLSTDAELQCTKTGQVASAFQSKTVVDFNQERRQQIARPREVPTAVELGNYRIGIQQAVREITHVGSFKHERGVIVGDRVMEAGVFSRGLAIVIADRGKEDPRVRRGVIDPILNAGYQVLALDLRGWGESEPHPEGADPRFKWDDFFAYRSLEIGRPLLGQRLKDLLAVGPSRTHRHNWTLVGVGAGAALVAAHGALLDARVDGLITIDGPLSFRSMFDDATMTQPISTILPGVLGEYDVRDLYAAGAPRRTLVLNPEDSQRRPVNEVRAWEEYDWALQAYEGITANDAFHMRSELDLEGLRDAITEWMSARS